MTGTLFGIGVGPGDPSLLTLKAAERLKRLDLLVYPAPLDGDSLARSIAAPHIPAGVEELALRMAFDPARRADEVYDAGARTIAAALAEGRDVGVLCEGDPLFFGSFLYLLARLGGSVPVEVIPGVSSLSAAAAALLHPLTAREDALTVIPATRSAIDIARLIEAAEAAAIMKLGRHLPKVAALLEQMGLADRALYIERASQPGQIVRPLADAARDARQNGRSPYFAMILVHKRGKAWN